MINNNYKKKNIIKLNEEKKMRFIYYIFKK